MLNNISWTVDLSATNIAPMRMQILHGEDLAISVRVLQSGVAMDLSTASATLFWQSAGMGEDWYSDDCAIIENVITTAWLHGNDSGADRYVFYVRLVLDGVVSYRVYGMISMLFSPNFIPNEVTLPTQVLDFAEVTLLNVPYALSSDLTTVSGNLTNYISANDMLTSNLSSDFTNHQVDQNTHADIRGLISDLSSTVGDIGSILDAINGEVI